MAIFLLFAIAFIVFQQVREKQYKIELLNEKLQNYNKQLADAMKYMGKTDETTLDSYVKTHSLPNLRVTIIDNEGHVTFDNLEKNYNRFTSHANRPEIIEAQKKGSGSSVERNSKTLKQEFFYSATYFNDSKITIRSALPYNNDLAKSLQTDQHFIWFALTTIIILTLVLWRFLSRLGANITKLKLFASRADHNESLETEDLIAFPDDELGEIAERIIKIYKRLQSTRQEQDKLKRQLTQNIAHELKTPVASIQGYLETILDNPHIDEETKKQFLKHSYAQSQRLTSLLQDISTLNRMDDAPEIKENVEVNISEMVEDIRKETALQLEKHHMSFIINLPENIIVHGNKSLLYSVFRNLTDNAITYAGYGTTITLDAVENNKDWSFAFYDNGIGVANEHLSRIFERFYRVDKGRSRKLGGTGLGLAIVKNAVMIHGGTIQAKNLPTGGLRFDFNIKKNNE
ncbi:histidine kinase [Hoylesella timonensis]|uniref:histidine kinase n=2 Tax=Hoylesella timonensis TaxID=386414 RepID=A0A2K0XD30_9BACT|nr:histidine kinase [Hoylesella timonensis]